MKKQIAKPLTFITASALSLVFLASCKKNDGFVPVTSSNSSSDVTTRQGRLVFANTAAFYAKMNQLDRFTDAQLAAFEKGKAYTSFNSAYGNAGDDAELPAATRELVKLPPGIRTLLNANAEVQIGDTIIWYHAGVKHYIPNADEANLQRIKANPEQSRIKAMYELKTAPIALSGEQDVTNPATIYLSNSADARHQFEFWQQFPAAGWRKYVHEVAAYTDMSYVAPNTCGQATYFYNTGCYLYIKMEWKGRRGWNPAGESRNISYNLTCSGSSTSARGCGIIDYLGFYVTPSGSETRNSNLTLVLGGASGYTVAGIGWALSVEGSISQHVVGDVASNAWTNTGFPLW
jgi:hypothetical protein